MPRFAKTVKVAAAANSETRVELLTSTQEEPKHIVGLIADRNASLNLLFGIEREEIIEKVKTNHLDANFGFLELDHPLPVGQTAKGGYENTSGALINAEITVIYEIRRS